VNTFLFNMMQLQHRNVAEIFYSNKGRSAVEVLEQDYRMPFLMQFMPAKTRRVFAIIK